MAIQLEANYSKKLGLPGYSSHQFSISLKVEISDVAQVQAESARLYKLLQDGVDTSIREAGYLPSSNGHGNGNGHPNGSGNGNGRQNPQGKDGWNCSDKQRDLIERIIQENNLAQNQIEQLAIDRFGKGIQRLNKLDASALIEELLEMTGQKSNGKGRFQNRYPQKAGGR
jgi:hypothetical protein